MTEAYAITQSPDYELQPSEAHFERKIIIGLIIDGNFLRNLTPHEPEKLLRADFTRTVAKWAVDHFKRYGQPPEGHIKDIYHEKAGTLGETQANIINQFLTDLSRESMESPDTVDIDQAREYLRKARAERFVEDFGARLEKNDLKGIHDLIGQFQAKDLADETFGADYVYIIENAEVAEAVRGLINEELVEPGDLAYGTPTMKRLTGKHVITVNCCFETIEKLKQPSNMLSLRAVNAALEDLTGEHRQYTTSSFKLNPDLANRMLRNQLSDLIRPGHEFIDCNFPEIKRLCGPIETQSFNMLFGAPGVGKSFLAMEIAGAVTAGRPAMAGHWETPEKAKALYVDGEMLPFMIQQRFRMLGMAYCDILTKAEAEANSVVPELNLANVEVREILEEWIIQGRYHLVIFDNLFSLVSGLDTNKAQDWEPINGWFLRLRAKGISVVLIHHAGKGGDQLGTSARTFNINLSLSLVENEDREENTCSFKIKVVKQRGRYPGLSGKIYTCDDGAWTVEDDNRGAVEDRGLEVLRLKGELKPNKEVAKMLNVSEATISGDITRLVNAGLLMRLGKGRGINARYDITPEGNNLLRKELGNKWMDGLEG